MNDKPASESPEVVTSKGIGSSALLDSFSGYAIRPPDGVWDDDFPIKDSVAYTEEGAWQKFCRPALRREAYEGDGFRAVPVMIEIRSVPNDKADPADL